MFHVSQSLPKRDVDRIEPEYLTEAKIRSRERENLFAVLTKASWKIKSVDEAYHFEFPDGKMG